MDDFPEDWNGIVYPAKRPKGFDPLAYLAQYFDTVEINTSFYGPPRPSRAEKWVQSVAENKRFRFTAKLYKSFTHDRKPDPKDEKDFKDGIAPLAEADRLGALLMQFPWSFQNSRENREYLVSLHRRFAEYPLVLEVRHSSWAEPSILDLLAELNIGLCNIDQLLFHRSIKPDSQSTSAVGYIRLHGRNYRNWFSKTALSHERYDYLYSVEELEPWVDRIQDVSRHTKETYAVTNNHYLGQAAMNALEIAALIGGQPVPAPESLIARYPELKEYANE